jgi:integrase
LTKSGHLKQDEADMGERIVPIAPKFTNLINNYIENSTVEGDSLFNCSYTVSQDTFIAACKRAGSLQKETKIFRRFVSTQMRKLGASREEVKLRLGHSDDATQDIYVTHTDKNALNHAEKLFKTLN